MTSSEKLTLWTIQSQSAWEEMERNGILKANESYVWEDFRRPYQWLIGQMEQRIQDYEGGYPIWAWPQAKPDLRRSGHLGPGEHGVRVEFTANPKNILLSDFDAWHSVLDGTLFNPPEYSNKNGYFSVWTMAEKDPSRADEITKSWEQIFDVERLKQYDNEQIVQATLGSVALSQIVSVKYFTAR